MIAKPTSITGTGGKSGGCAWKAIELTSGDRFRNRQQTACVLVAKAMKAQTAGSGK